MKELKKDIINSIVEQVENINCFISKIYGVSHGVGYDLNVDVELKNGAFITIRAHAVRGAWACLGHLRPNNPFYQYTGSCDYYQERVINYWEKGRGITEYLNRFTKSELQELRMTYLGF